MTDVPVMVVGIHVTEPGYIIRNPPHISGVHIGILVAAPRVKIYGATFSDLVSSGGNGAAVVWEAGANDGMLDDCHVDGSNNRSQAAAFVWHPGSNGCRARGCSVRQHPRSGFSIGSTTYSEFPYDLPWSYGHDIQDCVADHCGDDHEGDASAGFVVVGMSHDMTLKNNVAKYCRDAGFAVSGSLKGTGAPGTPRYTESPTNMLLSGNRALRNGAEGVRVLGANYLKLYENSAYENGQGGRFGNYRVASLGPGADLRGLQTRNNDSDGVAKQWDALEAAA